MINMVDVSNFETTEDGSMVRIDMVDSALRANDPAGKFVDIDKAIAMEARGLCIIRRRRNKEGSLMINNAGLIMVEYLEQALIRSYGKYGTYSQKDADRGEKAGKWKIMRSGPGQGYDNKMMLPSGFTSSYETKGVKKKTVAWIQDSSIRGGAEISNELVIKVGIDCGFSISVFTPKVVNLKSEFEKADLVIFNNIWAFDSSQIKVIDEFISHGMKPYVKYEHDHRELSRPEFSRKLFANSILNVFLSPIHLDNHRQILGCEGICLPLAIDVDFFHLISSIERKTNTALICNVRNFKSWKNLQTYITAHPEIAFTVLSNGGPPVHGDNVKISSMVPYEKMPEVYSAYQYLVHLLDGWGANERVIWEAALCGCEIVMNKMVGARSWGSKGFNVNLTSGIVIREWLEKAPYLFWLEIDDRMKRVNSVKVVPEFHEAICAV